MTDSFYNIHGVTPLHLYPENMLEGDITNLCETDLLIIPCVKPDLCEVIDVFVNVCVVETKFIKRKTRSKWVIHGLKSIKVIYESNTSCQSVHSAHFSIPFCIAVHGPEHCDFFLAVEDIKVAKQECRSLYVSTLICVIKVPKYPRHYEEEYDEHSGYSRKDLQEFSYNPPSKKHECYGEPKYLGYNKCTCSKDAVHDFHPTRHGTKRRKKFRKRSSGYFSNSNSLFEEDFL